MPYTPTAQDFASWNNEIDEGQNVPQGTSLPTTQAQSTPWYGSNFHDPLLNAVYAAGDAWRNSYASALNAIPGVHIDMVHNSQPGALSSTVGDIAGNIGSYLTGGGLAGKALDAAKDVPYIGKIASALEASPDATGIMKYAPGMVKNALGNAAYGALTNNNDRESGAITGGALSPVADLVPGIANKAVQAGQYFMPTYYMKQILQGLSGGQEIEDAAKSVVGGIKNAYEDQQRISNGLYNPVYNSVRDSNLYNEIKKPDPLMSLDPQAGYSGYFRPQSTKFDISAGKTGVYPNLSQNIFNSYDSDLKDLHENFLKNPTFDNAHQLQSQLGVESAALSGGFGVPDPATRQTIKNLDKARTALKGDMDTFLSNKDMETGTRGTPQSLWQQYQNASDYFKDNVAPFRANNEIFGMAKGDITNYKPSALGNVFAAPDRNLDSVLSNLPQQTLNKLIFTKLGQRVPANNADAFMRNYESLGQQGLGSYISPELSNQVKGLKARLYARNALQYIPGAGLGALIGGAHGVPESLALGALGAGVGKPIMNYIQARVPLEKIAQALGNASSAAYPGLKTALLANIPPQVGGN